MSLVTIELSDRWGRPALVELAIRRDTVEIRCRETLVGIAERDQLRAWLRHPEGMYAYDEMAWLRVGNGIALAIDDLVPAHVLDDHVVRDLRERV